MNFFHKLSDIIKEFADLYEKLLIKYSGTHEIYVDKYFRYGPCHIVIFTKSEEPLVDILVPQNEAFIQIKAKGITKKYLNSIDAFESISILIK